MVPEFVTCDRCGRWVLVLCWEPRYADVDDLSATDYSCKIDCPVCDTRVQTVKVIVSA